MDRIATTVFAQSLSNFTCTFSMMRGGTLLILGHEVKVNFGTLYIKPCGHDSDYSFCPITFKLHMHICHDERRNPIDFTGSKVKVNFGTQYVIPCGHDSNYSFCPITFKLHMHICHDERRNPSDFGSRGQRSRSTLALST